MKKVVRIGRFVDFKCDRPTYQSTYQSANERTWPLIELRRRAYKETITILVPVSFSAFLVSFGKSVFSRVLRDSKPHFVGGSILQAVGLSVGPSIYPSVRPSACPSHFTFLLYFELFLII